MFKKAFSNWPSYTEEEIKAVANVLLSNKVNYWTGNKCREFETEFAKFADSKYAIAVYYIIATAEASANLARFDGIRYGERKSSDNLTDLYKNTRSLGLGDEVKRRIILGTYVLSSGYYDAYYNRAQKVRSLIKNDFEKVFKSCDVLLTPVSPTTAYLKGEKVDDPLKMYLDDILTTSVNLSGNCGISLPCGFSSNNLPIGMQLIGDYFREDLILKVAHLYEKNTEWNNKNSEIIKL